MKDSRSHFNNDGMDPDWKPADVKPPSDKPQGLALPLRAINVSSTDGFDLGWCAVDANNRVIGYCMTEAQANQLVAPFALSSGLANEDETPRTAHEQVHGVRPSVSGNDSFHFVSATFARQLERELAEMTRYRDMNNAELGRMTAKCNALLDARSARGEPWPLKLPVTYSEGHHAIIGADGILAMSLHLRMPVNDGHAIARIINGGEYVASTKIEEKP